MGFTCKLISLCQEPSMCESFLMSHLTSPHQSQLMFPPPPARSQYSVLIRIRDRVRCRVRSRLRVGVGVRVKVGFKDSVGVQSGQNSIAFGSAPRREAYSQLISQLDRPAVSQTETHTLGFLSVVDTGPSSGETYWSQDGQWPNGYAGGRRFEPRCGEYGGGGAAAGVHRPRFELPT